MEKTVVLHDTVFGAVTDLPRRKGRVSRRPLSRSGRIQCRASCLIVETDAKMAVQAITTDNFNDAVAGLLIATN